MSSIFCQTLQTSFFVIFSNLLLSLDGDEFAIFRIVKTILYYVHDYVHEEYGPI